MFHGLTFPPRAGPRPNKNGLFGHRAVAAGRSLPVPFFYLHPYLLTRGSHLFVGGLDLLFYFTVNTITDRLSVDPEKNLMISSMWRDDVLYLLK